MKEFLIQGNEIIEIKYKKLLAIRITKLILNNITLVNSNDFSQDKIEFHNEIKEITQLQKSEYIISDREHLSLISDLDTIENDRFFLGYCSKARILLNQKILK